MCMPNFRPKAAAATRAAKPIRPERESGVVLGSEIIKKVNSSNAPSWRRWSGTDRGSPM